MTATELIEKYKSGERNFRHANLWGADLWGADLRGADLRGAKYAIPQVLLANWGNLSDETCLALMRLDCEACPNGEKRFNAWAGSKGQECPFDGVGYQRIAIFGERWEIWQPGPAPTLWECWEMLAKECGVEITSV